MSDYTRWIHDFIRPGEPHVILPGRAVHLGVQATPVGLTADQAVEMACRLLECAGLTTQDILFADSRAPTSNERHLINLLSWREREARQRLEEIAVLREQVEVAGDRTQSWKNIAEGRATAADRERVGFDPGVTP